MCTDQWEKSWFPLKKKEDAQEFLEDHQGTKIISFDAVTMDLIKTLDQ